MRPEELVRLLTSMRVVADVVEALDDPALQVERCWELAGWSHEAMPCGVRFALHDGLGRVTAAVVAAGLPASCRAEFSCACANTPWPTTFLLLAHTSAATRGSADRKAGN